jgi:hypothetical protein
MSVSFCRSLLGTARIALYKKFAGRYAKTRRRAKGFLWPLTRWRESPRLAMS